MKQLKKTLRKAIHQAIYLSDDEPNTLKRYRSLLDRVMLAQAHFRIAVDENAFFNMPLTPTEARQNISKIGTTTREDYLDTLLSQAEAVCEMSISAMELAHKRGVTYGYLAQGEIEKKAESACWAVMEVLQIALHVIESAEASREAVAA